MKHIVSKNLIICIVLMFYIPSQTFDGLTFNYYGVGQQVQYRSTVRTFEIQARLWRQSCWGVNSLHCGLAMRENDDMIIVDMCQTGADNVKVEKRFQPGSEARGTAPVYIGNGPHHEVRVCRY